jgi:hypothetical protein
MIGKRTEVKRRLNRIEKELSAVEHRVRSLSQSGDRSGAIETSSPPKLRPHSPQDIDTLARLDRLRAASGTEPGRDRFADYLAARMEKPVQPLRHERRLQRNKAIVTAVFAVLLLFWVLYQLLG